MTKYRVIQQAPNHFVIERRFFFSWRRVRGVFSTFNTLEDAKKHIDRLSYKEKIVYQTEK
jgi:hypothetical protein